jgi:hypothetical protein
LGVDVFFESRESSAILSVCSLPYKRIGLPNI